MIKDAWKDGQGDVLRGIDKIQLSLGGWQHSRYKDRMCGINSLLQEIDKIINEPTNYSNIERLHSARAELGHLYTSKDVYSTQRSCIR